ncbi:DNA2/NAM7 family helicase [Rhizobium phaseoli]|uniref:DNA2/NAM7 family helicase n=1 Tax=Rhizobium phaseoli TaxID=396 RepID=UPI000B32805B|nr:DNA2/NAM7 family helicase [Rhizobium phaseoli]
MFTRAKRRFYIVGDRELWQTLPYFREAASALETVRTAEFLARNALDVRDPNPVLWD